jgi:hypothetical protein
MKCIFIFFGLVLGSLSLQAQTCDIYTTEFKPVKNEITAGESVDLVFSIKNNAKGVQCTYAEKSVQVYLFLPESGVVYDGVVFPSGGKGVYFDWEYDAAHRTLIGLNHRAIGDGQGEENITVRVKAVDMKVPTATKTLGLSIVQHYDGAVFPANDQSNDNTILSLRIKSGASQPQVQFDAINADCNVIDFVYGATDSKGVDRYEIYRSTDGTTFVKMSSQVIDPAKSNAVFTWRDNQNLENGRAYVYRLIAVNTDGSQKFVKSETIINDCSVVKADFDVFPNPAVDKMYVRLKGSLKNEVVDLQFTNSIGEIIKTAKAVSNERNEILLDGMPSGVYFLRIAGNDSANSKRLVKIDY